MELPFEVAALGSFVTGSPSLIDVFLMIARISLNFFCPEKLKLGQ